MKSTDLPTSCPSCAKPFSSLIRPKRQMQKKAILLFGVGIVVTVRSRLRLALPDRRFVRLLISYPLVEIVPLHQCVQI